MEIHASSINYSALKLNPRIAGQPNAVQNRGDRDRDDGEKLLQAPKPVSQTPEEIEQAMSDAGFSKYTPSNANPTDRPANTRLANAVNAYTATLNQPMQEQRAQLIAGIDFYV